MINGNMRVNQKNYRCVKSMNANLERQQKSNQFY